MSLISCFDFTLNLLSNCSLVLKQFSCLYRCVVMCALHFSSRALNPHRCENHNRGPAQICKPACSHRLSRRVRLVFYSIIVTLYKCAHELYHRITDVTPMHVQALPDCLGASGEPACVKLSKTTDYEDYQDIASVCFDTTQTH